MLVVGKLLRGLGMVAGLLLLSGMVLSPARAALVTYTFTGDVTSVSPLLTSQFNTSQSLSGSLTTNTSAPFNNNIQDFHVIIGAYTATMGTFGEFNIAGSPPSAFELDARVIKPTGDNVNSLAPDVFALDYLHNSADPTITGGAFNLFFESGKEAGNVIGTVTALTVVPLPPAVILFGVGLVALIGLGAGRLQPLRMPQG